MCSRGGISIALPNPMMQLRKKETVKEKRNKSHLRIPIGPASLKKTNSFTTQ
jgi:hypothetical protein